MTLARVELQQTGASSCTVVVDGRDLAKYVAGYTVTHRVGEVPRVVLDLIADGPVALDQADVVLPPFLTEGLIALGWTPPPGRELLGPAKSPEEAAAEFEEFQAQWRKVGGLHGPGCECDETGTDPRCAMKAVQP